MSRSIAVRPSHRQPWSGLAVQDGMAHVSVLGVPFDGAVSFRRGASQAPSAMRRLTPHMAPCASEGEPLMLRVKDYGDVPADLDWVRYFEHVERRAARALEHPLATFLGGDHSVTIPLMKAFSGAVGGSFGVVHFDAHPDLCDEFEGHRWSHACTARRALELPGLQPSNLVFVGLRSFLPEEWEYLNMQREITTYTARQCYLQGIESIARCIAGRLAGVQAVYVTLDVDGLDPAHAPGTGTPEGGGLTTRDLLELVRRIFQELPVRALDVVEVAPPLDHSDITSVAALKCIYEAWWAHHNRH